MSVSGGPSSGKEHVVVFRDRNMVDLEEVERPGELGFGTALVEARTTLVSIGTELSVLQGTHVNIKGGLWHYPIRPGYSFAGVVKGVGPGAYGLAEGDRVFCTAHHGSFAVVSTRKDAVLKLPQGLGFEEASFAHLGAISLHGVVRAGLKEGDSVAVIGQGLVGNLALQLSKVRGAKHLIAIDRNDWKLQRSLACGGTAAVNSGDPQLLDRVRSLAGGSGAAVVIEATGDPAAIETACRLCMDGGRVVLLGGPRGPTTLDFYSTVHHRDLRVIGAHSSNIGLDYGGQGADLRALLGQVVSLMVAGRLKTGPLVTHRVGWEKVPDLYRELSDAPGRHLGVLIDWTSAHNGPAPGAAAEVIAPPAGPPAEVAQDERVGFGIVGCGFIAEVHADAMAHSRRCRLEGVVDVDESRARRLGSKYGVPWYTSLDGLLDRREVSVVDVCTPPSAHAAVAEPAAAAGKHVLVEKPLEVTLEKADRIISACEKGGVRLGVVYQHRFRPQMRRVQAAFDQGQFGRVFLGSFQDRSSRTREYFDSSQWRREVLVQFIGEGIHGVDLLQHFLGQAERVSAYSSKGSGSSGGGEDTVVGSVEFAGGAVGTLEFTASAFKSLESRLELHGTEGSAVVEGKEARVWKFLKPRVRAAGEEKAPGPASLARRAVRAARRRLGMAGPQKPQGRPNLYDDHVPVLDDFARSVLTGEPPEVDGMEARKSLEIVLACDESIRTGEPVRLTH